MKDQCQSIKKGLQEIREICECIPDDELELVEDVVMIDENLASGEA